MGGNCIDHAAARPGQGAPQTVFLSVQYLRAVAALMVLFYHVGGAFAFVADGPVRPHWLSAGVDVFFLISGFVMVVSTEQRNLSGTRFFQERLARVVPLYWLVTCVFVAILAVQRRILPDPGEIASTLLFVFHQNPRTQEPSPIVTAGWTLNYEMIFYLLFAMSIHLAAARRLMMIAGIFLILSAMRPLVAHDDAFLFRMTSPQPLEFVAGMALAHVRHRLVRIHTAIGIGAIAAGFAGLALADGNFPRFIHFAPCATAIMAGAIVCERLVRRGHPALRLLGDSSYSLYLTHPLILEMLPNPPNGSAARAAAAAGTIACCIALALLFYRGFELPTIRFFRRHLRGHPALAAVR